MTYLELFLDLSPIPAPLIRPNPSGEPCDFYEVVRAAEMLNVVSTPHPPDIRIHDGPHDFKAVRPGKVVYCLAGVNLPSGILERNREIMRRLAYGFHDWAAREIVAKYHRDLKRSLAVTPELVVSGKANLT